MPHASWIPAVDERSFDERMKDLFLLATELFGIEYESNLSLSYQAQLARLRAHVEELIDRADTTPERRSEAYELLTTIHRLQHTDLDTALAHQLSSLSEIRDGIDDLSELAPRELVGAAPVRVCRDLSFGRALISTISGSVWLPQHLHIEEDRGPETRDFEEFVDGARIPLSEAPMETELIRRRTPTLVPDPLSDKRTHKRLVGVARSWGYVAAPITLRGKAVGMLHADRPQNRGLITLDDLELLATFAECLSIILESAILQDRMQRQVKRATDAYAQVVSMLDDGDTELTWAPHPLGPARTSPRHPQSPPPGSALLTSREREVLAHLATGATNAQIARNLVVSEATIKSHLKQISRKLGTSSRAAAVAAYVRMTQKPYGIAP